MKYTDAELHAMSDGAVIEVIVTPTNDSATIGGLSMIVTTRRDTADHDNDGVVIPQGTTGEVIGDGFTGDDGRDYIAVDFGNVIADVPVEDLA